jgi:peptide deformylase
MRLPGRYDGVARPIVTYGSNPVLHRACAPVTEFDEGLRRLLLDMFASMEAADGVGLAANQIGVDARIFVIDCPDADGEDVVGYAINPTLALPDPVDGEPAEEVTEEGCLSVPGPYAELPRAFRARVDGVDVKGDPVTIEATGMAARCLQHEVDHLNGTVYVDLLPEEQRERLLAEAAGPSGDLPA